MASETEFPDKTLLSELICHIYTSLEFCLKPRAGIVQTLTLILESCDHDFDRNTTTTTHLCIYE